MKKSQDFQPKISPQTGSRAQVVHLILQQKFIISYVTLMGCDLDGLRFIHVMMGCD